MTKILALWNEEPVRLYAFVQAGIAAGISFGLDWTGEQVGAVMMLTSAALALVIRRKVTPTDG
jgi:hypothetical protein